MSNKKKVNRRRHRSPWYKLFAKTETRLSARVTREEDWQTDVPNIRLSRAFVIVLLMHLVVGGALVAFTLMNPHEADAALPQKSDKVAKVDDGKAPAKATHKAVEVTPGAADKVDDMRRHIVHSGDNVKKIAQQYGVTPEEIYAVNVIDELYQLYQGRVLRIPVSTSAPLPLNPRIYDAPSNNGSNLVTSDSALTMPTIPRAGLALPGDSESAEETAPAEETTPAESPLLPEPAAEVAREVPVEETHPARSDEGLDIVRPLRPEAPSPPVASSEEQYTVVRGDNPFRIAKRFGVNYKDLLRHNGIRDPSKLQIGQTLSIPN